MLASRFPQLTTRSLLDGHKAAKITELAINDWLPRLVNKVLMYKELKVEETVYVLKYTLF